jgi:hypothetical protein
VRVSFQEYGVFLAEKLTRTPVNVPARLYCENCRRKLAYAVEFSVTWAARGL